MSMKIQSVEFAHIKSFKSLKFDLEKTSVLIGQNDHGKSSILKAIDIILNRLDDQALKQGALHPDLAERLLPIFPVNAKARRITLNYIEAGTEKQLYINVRANLTFAVLERIQKNATTTPAALKILRKLKKHNRFVLIPALRDTSSPQYQELFSRMLKEHGLESIIPQRAGGTPREYRTLKDIRDQISKTIKPYINKRLLPKIEKNFGFSTQHKLALKFDVDVQDIGQWILDNLRMGFQLTSDEDITLALSEAGTGVQSGVLLALHRLEQKAAENPSVQFILAIEEPEAFLHPQKQKELYRDIRAAQSANLRVIVTTHSPYIVSETPFSQLGLVKKVEHHSALHVPEVKNPKEQEVFDAYSNEVNSVLFFADKVIFVEGESDLRVIKYLLDKTIGPMAHRIAVVSAAGNKNFSPFLRMVRAWITARIPHLVVTDFDSLTTETDRAIITGAKAAGYQIQDEQAFRGKIDGALDKSESDYVSIAEEAQKLFDAAGLNVFIFTSDLENALITSHNKDAAAQILTRDTNNGTDYGSGFDLGALKRMIGSKGVPLNPSNNPKFKKPYIHRKIAETIDLNNAHPDIVKLLNAVRSL